MNATGAFPPMVFMNGSRERDGGTVGAAPTHTIMLADPGYHEPDYKSGVSRAAALAVTGPGRRTQRWARLVIREELSLLTAEGLSLLTPGGLSLLTPGEL